MRFAISTYLFHEEVLGQQHLEDIAARGFEAIELFSLRSHFDYHSPDGIRQLAEWLRETGLSLHGVHAPIRDSLRPGEDGPLLSLATADPERRAHALRETDAALAVMREIPADVLVLHLGVPDALASDTSVQRRDRTLQSLETLQPRVAEAGARLALEVIPNVLSTPEALVRLIEDDLEHGNVGICLDLGHAFLMGDLIDAIEASSGHLISTHVHDNQRKCDEHRVPFDGAIDWPSALMALQKIGYDGRLVFELNGGHNPRAALDRASHARDRLKKLVAW